MVPQPDSIAQQRCRALASQNASSSSLFIHEPAKRPSSASRGKGIVTYGKSSRPLSLTGKQFRVRADTYDIPSDDEERTDRAHALLQAAAQRNTDSSDSPLSDAESDAPAEVVEPTRVSRGLNRLDVLEAAASAAGLSRAVASSARSKKGTAKAVRKPGPKPVYPAETDARPVRASKSKRVAKGVANADSILPKAVTKKQAIPPARRLPVNELMLVASAPQYDDPLNPRSSAPGVQTQDPIRDLSGQPRRRSISSVSSDSGNDRPTSRAPLTVIRKRLKTPKFQHKVLKRKQSEQSFFWGPSAHVVKPGDGFDDTELHIDYRFPTRKQHKRKTRAPLSYNVLQLASGPLPDVFFECSTDELQLEPNGGPHHVSQQAWNWPVEKQNAPPVVSVQDSRRRSTDEVQLEPSGVEHRASRHGRGQEQPHTESERVSQRFSRRVSFSDKEQLIIAQLSSVSAPEREWSVSEDGDEDSLSAEDDEEPDEEVEKEVLQSGSRHREGPEEEKLLSDEELSANAALESEPPPVIPPVACAQHIVKEPRNAGVTLDFRKPAFPGAPRRSLARSRLIEVDEAIVDPPERVTIQASRIDTAAIAGAEDNFSVDITSHQPHHRRPRSILKKSTPVVPDSTCSTEHTVANTRRNSKRHHSMIDAEDSRYFAQAEDTLRSPDPAKHTIMRRRSSYFSDPYVQVADSERVILETSPEPPNFAEARQLTALRVSSESVYTSQSLPTVSRDLGALTRTVSREHGTLSQSIRRRPSLPFQSPTKVR
ncbi:hypothetical protein LTR36_003873 [Oleoguttula mirabilis]|uniref:Uncharacterized protein n=1 Tax=Oleoguttula mirabilis TaxID=1507867 RepID=A0AAV9JI87_9PEZI|nr:hypothetical protein LTR36_003873 [Oleoguttula mirabilis]